MRNTHQNQRSHEHDWLQVTYPDIFDFKKTSYLVAMLSWGCF